MEPRALPEVDVFRSIAKFLHRVAQEGAVELESFGMTPAQFQLLVQIRARPGISQWQLADCAGVTKGNISQLVKKVEEAGLVERVRNQGTDELSLTQAGEALLATMVPAHDTFMKRTFAALSSAELDQLRAMIVRLAHS